MALGDPYVTVAELKAELGITDSVDDAKLTRAVSAATEWVTAYCGRDFNKSDTATARLFTPTESGVLEVDDFYSTSGLVIGLDTDDDGIVETTWTAADYELRPVGGYLNGVTGWPYTTIATLAGQVFPIYGYRSGRVSVTAKWGWAAVPNSVKAATLLVAAKWFKRKDSPEGVLGGFGDFGPVRVSRFIDSDVAMELQAYRRNVVRVG